MALSRPLILDDSANNRSPQDGRSDRERELDESNEIWRAKRRKKILPPAPLEYLPNPEAGWRKHEVCAFCGSSEALGYHLIHHPECPLFGPVGEPSGNTSNRVARARALCARERGVRGKSPTRVPWSELSAEERSNVERGQLAAGFHQVATLACRRCGGELIRNFTLTCANRLCGKCAHRKSRRSFQRLQARLATVPQVRHLRLATLTIKNDPNLGAALATLTRAFDGLRHSQVWKAHVKGGFRVLETTNTGHGWHPHLHVLIHVPMGIPYAKVRDRWEKLTGGSFVVDFRRCYGDIGKVGAYVGKYLSKGVGELQNMDQETEYRYEVKGRRLSSSLGEWYASNGPWEKKSRFERVCGCCGGVDKAAVAPTVPFMTMKSPGDAHGHALNASQGPP